MPTTSFGSSRAVSESDDVAASAWRGCKSVGEMSSRQYSAWLDAGKPDRPAMRGSENAVAVVASTPSDGPAAAPKMSAEESAGWNRWCRRIVNREIDRFADEVGKALAVILNERVQPALDRRDARIAELEGQTAKLLLRIAAIE